MAVATSLLTVAEFEKLPVRPDGGRQELHHGELFEMPPVKLDHTLVQKALAKAFDRVLNSAFEAFVEFPFQPRPEHQVWMADLAIVAKAHLENASRAGYYQGVPIVVIEVLSSSNSATEMLDRERICLANGGREFWLMDPGRRTVKVTTADGATKHYASTDRIPPAAELGAGSLDLSEIWP